MKTIIRLLVTLPLLSLGGCYTQFALRDYDNRGRQEESKVDQYAYEDQDEQVDSTDNYEENENYPYDDSDSYNSGYRRYLYDYYPSLAFSMGWGWGFDMLNRDHFFYGLYDQGYYGNYPGYYWPWYYGNYGYYYPYYNNYYPYGYNNYSQGINKYRTYSALRTRGNDGERGTGGRYRDVVGGDRSRSSDGYVKPTGSERPQDVDLGRSRVSRGNDNTKSDGTRVSKKSPNSSDNSARDRSSGTRTRDRNGSRATDNSSNRGRERSTSERGSSGSNNSGRERQAPSYSPRGETSRAPSYSPPPSSSGSNSGRSSGGSERGSSGSERKR
jgi:hypothetical protein